MPDEIRSIVEQELGETPVEVARVAEGLQHETYEIRCGSGEYVLQFTAEVDESQRDSLARGLGLYRALADSDIPVPGVVTPKLRTFGERAYSLVEQLPGDSGECDVSPERARDAGRYLARIHAVRCFDEPGWIRFEDRQPVVHEFEEGGLAQWVRQNGRETVRALRRAELETVAREVERVLDRVGASVPDTFQPVLCHDDFSPDNVLFRGGEVTGVLDFDRAFAGYALRDLVKAANCFWMHDPASDWNPRTELYAGYRDVAGLGSDFERAEPRHRVETLAGTVAGMLRLGELSEYEIEFYGERILEAVERVDCA